MIRGILGVGFYMRILHDRDACWGFHFHFLPVKEEKVYD